ncbi:hypothetical protein, partial [Escherichia coli]|uniref:hypothetical protein n=1 Tax=Escherichia coli TaxID=562 RepID=UPI001BC8A41B
ILTFQNHTNRPLTDFGGKTSIFSHPVYLFLREFSLQDFRGGSYLKTVTAFCLCGGPGGKSETDGRADVDGFQYYDAPGCL